MGYIYIIKCNITGDYYIGSTCNVASRIMGHRSCSNKTASRDIIERGNYSVDILEEIEEGLDMRFKEQEHIDRLMSDKLVNRQRAMRSEYENALIQYESNKCMCECECGTHIRRNHMSRHRRSAKHNNLMSES